MKVHIPNRAIQTTDRPTLPIAITITTRPIVFRYTHIPIYPSNTLGTPCFVSAHLGDASELLDTPRNISATHRHHFGSRSCSLSDQNPHVLATNELLRLRP